MGVSSLMSTLLLMWIAVEKLWITLATLIYERLMSRINFYLLYAMATSGYSGTPLLKKLGIKPAMKLVLINQPSEYYEWIEMNLNDQLCRKNQTPDFIHLFVQHKKDFENEMKKVKPLIKRNTEMMIWVSWYKKAAKIETDITKDVIRNYALQNDLVDVKVCAVS